MEKLNAKIFYEKSHIFLKQDNLSDNSTAFCRKNEAFSRKTLFVLSFRTERSAVKNLEYIHVIIRLYVSEILRFALNDKSKTCH